MQYKIPVQIENEDPILLWLWLKQLAVVMWWSGLWYGIFNTLQPSFWTEAALVPTVIVVWISLLIAMFKQYEMTFIPFVLAILRFNINFKERYWIQNTDSFSPLEIWNVILNEKSQEEKVDFENKMDQIKNLENSLNKL